MNSAARIRLLVSGCLLWSTLVGMTLFGRTVTQQSAMVVAPTVPFSKGRLEKLDAVRKTLTIQTKSGLQTFWLTDRTRVFHGKEELSMDRLKTGDIVAVRFALDGRGDRVARIIKLDTGTEPSPLDIGTTPSSRPIEMHP